MEKEITIGSKNASDRQYQLCKCSNCGVSALCEPHFDFYGEDGKPLICEECFKDELKKDGIQPINF